MANSSNTNINGIYDKPLVHIFTISSKDCESDLVQARIFLGEVISEHGKDEGISVFSELDELVQRAVSDDKIKYCKYAPLQIERGNHESAHTGTRHLVYILRKDASGRVDEEAIRLMARLHGRGITSKFRMVNY